MEILDLSSVRQRPMQLFVALRLEWIGLISADSCLYFARSAIQRRSNFRRVDVTFCFAAEGKVYICPHTFDACLSGTDLGRFHTGCLLACFV
jgi:hypothetical protein